MNLMTQPRSKKEARRPVEAESLPPERPRGRGWRMSLGLVIGLGSALVIALIATAIVFSVARGTADVATAGITGVYEEASLSAAAAARNRTVQSHLIAQASAQGIIAGGELSQSLVRAEGARVELTDRIDRLAGELGDGLVTTELRTRASALDASLGTVIELVRTGDTAAAGIVIEGELEPTYASLIDLLADERDLNMAEIALSRQDAGRLADAARFIVVLLVPLLVLISYRARVRSQQRRRELEQRLEKQEAVTRTKDEFIANLSHELRTPLTGIYGFALELIDGPASQDPAISAELAKLIASESGDLTRMVEDLLTAATADQERLVISLDEVDPVAEVAEVLAPLEALGRHVPIDMQPARISADPLRLRQIIRNLVSNAERHGGPSVRVAGRRHAMGYTIEVRDDGGGVPPELEDRLFTRFIHEGTAPLITGSVGLGLSIVDLLVERTGGTITYRREAAETVFAVTYPVVE